MHNLFYGIGGVSILPAAYLLYRSIDGGGIVPLQWALYVFLGACFWLAIGRGLELLERLADALAPVDQTPQNNPSEPQSPQEKAVSRGL